MSDFHTQLSAVRSAKEGLADAIEQLPSMQGSWLTVEKQGDRIHRELKGMLDMIEDLKLFAEDLPTRAETAACLKDLTTIEFEYSQLLIQLRKAKLTAKSNVQKRALNEREELLKGGSLAASLQERKNITSKTAEQKSLELTESLRQAVQMMSGEVEKSAAALQSLGDSSQVLSKTNNQYSAFESVMGASGTLLTQLNRQSLMDRVVLVLGFSLFMFTVLYVLWKRTWIPGASLLFPKKASTTLAKHATTALSSLTSTITQSITSITSATPTTTAFTHRGRDEL
ncbi:Protein transport protein sec20 [Blyttiomyces sp. JEL0837]|nr:Protein transport protein sec20 [Blyttiomyces sp. JEL0837]